MMELRDRFRVGSVREYSAGYYGICAVGGMLSAGTARLAVTPLDVLKVNMQVNPLKYTGITSGLTTLWKEEGATSLWRGWSVKLFGYGIQGGFRYGLYEYFKKLYSDKLVDPSRSSIFFMSAASAQVFADVALCPFEAVKVRIQSEASFAKGLTDGLPKIYRSEGFAGFYKGLAPLWCRNIPFAMVMFPIFEYTVDIIYHHMFRRRKDECTRVQQLTASFLAGCSAGAIGTVVSNPADNIVSSLYNKQADTIRQAMKKIGFVNLVKRSLLLRSLLVGPVITLQWFFYDSIKVLAGLPTSGGLPRHLEEDTKSASEGTPDNA